jgi:hypothetical protein
MRRRIHQKQKSTEDEGQPKENRHLVPLGRPIATSRLVHQYLPELAYAGGRAPALEAGSLAENVAANCVTGLVDDLI